MDPDTSVDIDAAFEQGTPIDEAMNEAVRETVLRHRQADVPLVTWREGRIAEISPEDSGGATKSSSEREPNREAGIDNGR